MKNLLLIALLLVSTVGMSQVVDSTKLTDLDDAIFTKAEKEASFPGGIVNWSHYLQSNLDAAVPIKHGAHVGTYTVIIQFVVSKDGSIRDVQPQTSFGYGMEEEAMRVIKNGPHWEPAMQSGRPVNAYRRQPITFLVQQQ